MTSSSKEDDAADRSAHQGPALRAGAEHLEKADEAAPAQHASEPPVPSQGVWNTQSGPADGLGQASATSKTSPPSGAYLHDQTRGPAADKGMIMIIAGLICILVIVAVVSFAL
ncbi:hypothetical protein [Paracoccus yeei]|uniref:hypothetical protein n=1 Tax=Paracoccus yeei TaxID=147645 RepID=UPI0011804DAE|nr:hypothetical protein [Paracoccus yeei]